MIHLTEYIGEPATYEHLAEEASELAKAALKYARYLRGENPTIGTKDMLEDDVVEEATDVLIMLEELNLSKGDPSIRKRKVSRMVNRLIDFGKLSTGD